MDKGECATKLVTQFGARKATIIGKRTMLKTEKFCTKMSPDTVEIQMCHIWQDWQSTVFMVYTRNGKRNALKWTNHTRNTKQLNYLLMGIVSFTASNGWLDWWKKRHGICQLTVCSKILSSNQTSADDYKIKFKNLLSSLNIPMEQVYNCNDTFN